MRLTPEQSASYTERGYLFLDSCFTDEEVDVIQAELPGEFAVDSPRRVMEKGTNVVRSVYGGHAHNPVFGCMARHPRLVEPARQMLGSDVYVHQFKINAKVALAGEVWEWHQDFIFWLNEDGMPENRVTNALVFLDEVNEFNGPLLMIPGSHREGVVDGSRRDGATEGPSWANDVSADLKYSLTRDRIAPLVERSGIVAAKGPRGSVLFFDANIFHSSAPNMSPWDRRIAIVTYNSVHNLPVWPENQRPEFLAARDHTPIVPVADDALRTAGMEALARL